MMKTVARFLFACLFGASFPLTVHSAPVVSEIMASNARTLADDDGDFSDWIEIYNPSPAPLSLNGYFLTDDSALLTKWQFPDITISANGRLLVFASGKDRTNTAARLHTNFELDADGEFLALVGPNTNIVSGFIPSYPA